MPATEPSGESGRIPKGKLTSESYQEDGCRSPSKFKGSWNADTFLWRLDVNEQFPTITLHYGTLVFRGSFDGILTLGIEDCVWP